MSKEYVPVSGIWLRTAQRRGAMVALEVLAETQGIWRLLFTEWVPAFEAEVSHIVEPSGMKKAPPDYL